jgi:hypothetical protein
MRALDVADKTRRVANYQRETVASAMQVIASMGLDGPDQLEPRMLLRRIDHTHTESYAELFEHLAPGQLLAGVHDVSKAWARDWVQADPDVFRP